ncbi:MAG: 16S rRNA (uracil(1498)-N(3))-methyltransferase [Clostridia bacterium]
MSFQKIFANQHNQIIGGQVIINDPSDVQHLSKVLRISVGDNLVIGDQEGTDYLLVIEQINKQDIKAKIIKKYQVTKESKVQLYLLQGLAKGEKMDWIVQKSVELGVAKIFPLQLERCIIKVEEKKEQAKTARWQKIAAEAAAQSQRNYIPEVMRPQTLKEVLQSMPNITWLVAFEEDDSQGLTACLQEIRAAKTEKIGIVIGPEGGLALSEVQLIEAYGGKSISLGKRILRTETAAITALSILQFTLGDIGGE